MKENNNSNPKGLLKKERGQLLADLSASPLPLLPR